MTVIVAPGMEFFTSSPQPTGTSGSSAPWITTVGADISPRWATRPSADAITLFESQGIGIEDVAASAYVVRKAREAGIGQELPF